MPDTADFKYLNRIYRNGNLAVICGKCAGIQEVIESASVRRYPD
jgi:hypothetical protein